MYDKPLDTIVKEQLKAKRNAKKSAAQNAVKKAKLAKGGKPKPGNKKVGKNRNTAPIRGGGRARGGGRSGRGQTPAPPVMSRGQRGQSAGPPRGGRGGRGGRGAGRLAARAVQQAVRGQMAAAPPAARRGQRATSVRPVPRGGIKSASAMKREGVAQQRTTGITTGLKVHVDNLDFGVTEKDMRELFGEFGALKKVELHFNAQGKSQGNCDILFGKRADGLRAIKKYNNVPLDGRRMKIEIVGAPVPKVVSAPKPVAARPRAAPKPRNQGNNQRNQGRNQQQMQPVPSQKKKKLLIRKKKPAKQVQKAQPQKNAAPKKAPIRKAIRGKKVVEKKKPLTEEDLDRQLDAYLVAGAQ